MSRNLELKARCSSLVRGRRIAASLGAKAKGILRQKDTFLLRGPGRLKLREEPGAVPELIFYGRSDSSARSGRVSSFLRLPVADGRKLMRNWPRSRDGRIIVRKQRWLYLYRNARIHLDSVHGLGTFIEFEVLLVHGRRQAQGLLRQLVRSFNIRDEDVLGCAYADLLDRRLQR